jgi:hypothetical protein
MSAHEASADDPFDAVLRPPPNETAQQRAVRIAKEEEATRISQAIDENIRLERQRNKKKRIVRVLLLGQSESGELCPWCDALHLPMVLMRVRPYR